MKLTKFIVQGWAKDLETGKRIPLRKSTIEAVNKEQAMKTYARCQGLKSRWIRGKDPLVILRTEYPRAEHRQQQKRAA